MPDQTIHADQLLEHADHILSAEEQITKLHEQLADAHAAGARSATQADNLRGIVERVSALVDRLHHEGLATIHAEELRQALNAPGARPGSSRRAQDGEQIAPEYLIWSHHHQCWWGPNGSGYRRDITNAGRYTLADTKKWLGRGCGCCPVPEVVIPAPGPEVLTPAGRTDRWVAEQIEQATRARAEAGQTNPYVTQSLPTSGGRP